MQEAIKYKQFISKYMVQKDTNTLNEIYMKHKEYAG